MKYIEDYSESRSKAWCIHCGRWATEVEMSNDHVPTKSLLSPGVVEAGAEFDRGAGDEDDYLPQVSVCRPCNSGFARDESYLKCVLHAVLAGGLRPHPDSHPEAATYLRSNRHFVRELEAGIAEQRDRGVDPATFTVFPDQVRLARVALKNARGHVYHEIGEPMLNPPTHVGVVPLRSLSRDARRQFESIGEGNDLWPEVGSRMLVRVLEDSDMQAGGWIDVEDGRYRYAVDWGGRVTVRSVIWDYLATEVYWEDSGDG